MVENKFLAGEAGYLRHDGRRKRKTPAHSSRIPLPATPHDRVAAAHQKPIARISSLGQIVYDSGVIEQRQPKLVAAIDNFIEKATISVGCNRGAQYLDIAYRFDESVRIPRRVVNIYDHRIVRIIGRHRNCGAGDDSVVGANWRERAAFECRRFNAKDLKLDELCVH